MSFSVQETLFSLLQHNAISGHENAVADVMLCEFRRQAKEVWRDRLGNVVARYGSDKPDALRLMIFAHMDEVGFMVQMCIRDRDREDAPHPRIKQLARFAHTHPGGPPCHFNDIIPLTHCPHDVQDLSLIHI